LLFLSHCTPTSLRCPEIQQLEAHSLSVCARSSCYYYYLYYFGADLRDRPLAAASSSDAERRLLHFSSSSVLLSVVCMPSLFQPSPRFGPRAVYLPAVLTVWAASLSCANFPPFAIAVSHSGCGCAPCAPTFCGDFLRGHSYLNKICVMRSSDVRE
jgi:hypothetical protein